MTHWMAKGPDSGDQEEKKADSDDRGQDREQAGPI